MAEKPRQCWSFDFKDRGFDTLPIAFVRRIELLSLHFVH